MKATGARRGKGYAESAGDGVECDMESGKMVIPKTAWRHSSSSFNAQASPGTQAAPRVTIVRVWTGVARGRLTGSNVATCKASQWFTVA